MIGRVHLVNKYEKGIIKEVKEFAIANGIPFGKMIELLIIHAIRTVKKQEEDTIVKK